MRIKQPVLSTALLVVAVLFPLYGQQILVMPGSGSTNPVTQAYSPDLATSSSSFSGSAGAFIALSNPAGTQYYLLSNSGGSGKVDVFTSSGTLSKTITLGSTVSTGAVSPDGKRLLVLAGQLYVFDITGSSPAQLAALDAGSPSYDLAISLDSKRAFVTTATALVGVDLTGNPPSLLASSLPMTNRNLPTRVATGPNGLIYVTVPEELWEIDGGSATGGSMAKVRTFPLGSGVQLAKPSFSPDGTYLIAGNIGTPLPSMARLNLGNRTITLSVANTYPTPDLFLAPNTNGFLGYSSTVPGFLYNILNSNFNGLTYASFNGQLSPGVKSAVLSNEVLEPQALYIGSYQSVMRVDLATNQIAASQPVGGIVAYLAPASTAAVSTLMQDSPAATTVQAGTNTLPIVVRALDSNGRPVFNAPVTWSAPGLTAQATMAATNTDGFAQAVYANVPAGTYTVTATAGSKSVSFQVTASAGGTAPAPAGGLSITSGNGQVTTQGNPVNLEVQLTDANGNVKAGVEILWTISQPGGGSGTLTAASGCTPASSTSTMTCTTDENGKSLVSFLPDSLSGEVAQFTITAEAPDSGVTFSETAVSDLSVLRTNIDARTTIRGPAGQTLPGAIQVQVGSTAGALPDVGVRVTTDSTVVTAACAGPGGVALTDSGGNASCDLALGGGVGSANLTIYVGGQAYYGYTLVVDPGQPATITADGGNNQSGSAGQKLPLYLLALITDAGGHPVPGATASWSVISGSATLFNTGTQTDYNGHVSTGVTLGSTPGPVKIQVTSGAGSFVFTVTVNGTLNLTKVDGDNQTAVIGTQFAKPLTVQVTGDSSVGPIAGTSVTFSVTSGNATLSTPAVTDASGKTSVTVTAGQTAGPIQVTATAGNQTQTFNLTARLPGPVLTPASFVNAASFAQVSDGSKTGITHGSIVSIIGDGITSGIPAGICVTGNTIAGALPTRVAGIEVQFGDLLSPIYHVCRTSDGKDQVTIQVPFPLGVPSTTTAVIRTNADSSAPQTTAVDGVNLLPSAPGIFEWTPANSGTIAVAVHPDGTYVSPSSPARKGETIRVYTTGLGVSATPPTQTNVPGIAGQSLFQTPAVQIGGQGAGGVTAEYAQNMVGIWIVTFQVPDGITVDQNGLAGLSVTVADMGKTYSSQTSRIPIGQ
jgi:uncharacterized protein (TIGR03437 family)